MPFPAGATTITVTGTLPVPAGGTAHTGRVIFTPSARLVDSTQQAIYSGFGPAALDANGQFSLELLCNDDTDIQPTGWRWHVDEQPAGGQRTTYFVDLPSSLGATVDLSELAPVSAPGGTGQSLPPTGPAGGALDGAYPNPSLSAATIASFDAAGSAAAAQTAAEAYTDTVAVTKAALAHAAQHAAAGSDPVTLTQAQITGLAAALAALAPLAGATFTGAITVDGADLTVLDTGSKGYRFRRGGGALDLEGTGSDLLISNWSGTDFDGAQRSYLRLSADAQNIQVAGKVEFAAALYGAVRHVLDGAADQVGFHGATPVGQQTVTGSRTDGTALASLLTALATLGLIVDNSTA